MALPTVLDVRAYLEGYCAIDSSVISDAWITARMSNHVIPIIQKHLGFSIQSVDTVTEYRSGTGEDTLILGRKGVIQLLQLQFVAAGSNTAFLNLANLELIPDEGILKTKNNIKESWIYPLFPKGKKNIKVTYTIGYDLGNTPPDIFDAIILLTCELMLTQIAGRDGGGDIGIQAYSKAYGNRGKYGQLRNDLIRQFWDIIKKYRSRVI